VEYDNTNTGALFFEQDPETERHPNYKGTINVDGKEYWLSAWDKVSKNGKNFISLSIKAKEPKAEVTDTRSGYEKAKAVAQGLKDTTDYDKQVSLSDIPFN
jgi:uncharacterized protein (DUF736 family)